MWHIKITSVPWVVNPVLSQTVQISYREGGTAGAFLPAGTVTVNETGAITSSPNPFVIDISDTWASAEVKAVNTCNNAAFTKTFDIPWESGEEGDCDYVALTGSPVLPDAVVGVEYSYSIPFTGTAPVILASIIKPLWMTTPAIEGNNIVFGGTPTEEASDVQVSFTPLNCNWSIENTFTQTINVNAA